MAVSFKLLLLLAPAMVLALSSNDHITDLNTGNDSITIPLVPLPDSEESSLQRRGDLHLAVAKSQFGIPFRVGVGSAARSDFVLVVDTGSPLTLINSAVPGHLPFTDPRHREWGRQETATEMSIEFQDGKKYVGQYFKNSVSLDGVKFTQPFLRAKNFVPAKFDNQVAGVMGFAFPFRGYLPPWWKVLRTLRNKRFSVYLPMGPADQGHITFGGETAACMVAGTAKVFPVDMNGMNLAGKNPNNQLVDTATVPKNWILPFNGISLPGNTFRAAAGTQALVDTGAPSIHGPAAEVATLYQNLLPEGPKVVYDVKKGVFFIKSPTPPAPPELELDLGGRGVVTWRPAKFWTEGIVPDQWVGLIRPSKKTWWVLGQPFLRSFYTTFEADSNNARYSVAFAKRRTCTV